MIIYFKIAGYVKVFYINFYYINRETNVWNGLKIRSETSKYKRRHTISQSHNGFSKYLCSSLISSLAPKKTWVRSCIVVGWMSKIFCFPFVPIPPATSIIKEAGLHSYSSRSFPLGDALLLGYKKIPPYIKVRWKSAMNVPMYLIKYSFW